MGQAPSTPNSGSPKRRFATLGRASTFASQYMPGDVMGSPPSAAPSERPTSPEPPSRLPSQLATPVEAQRRQESTNDVEPGQLLHTTFPFSRGEDAGDSEDPAVSPSITTSTPVEASVNVQIVGSGAQTPQFDHPVVSDAEEHEASSSDVDEAWIAKVAEEETHLRQAGPVISVPLLSPVAGDTEEENAGAVEVVAVVSEELSVSPVEDSTHVPHANVSRGSDGSTSSETAVETVEAEREPAVPFVPAVVPQLSIMPVVEFTQDEPTEDGTSRESEGQDIPLTDCVEEREESVSNDDVPTPHAALPTAAAPSPIHLIVPLHHDHTSEESTSSSDRAESESAGESSESESSNDERTLDLVLQDREAWEKNEHEPVHVLEHPAPPRPWSAGTYVLTNVRSDTALDLSAGDQRSVTGWPRHGHPNQQWRFVPCGQGYLIKSGDSFLTVQDGLCDNALVIASAFPASWNVVINHEEETMRIHWPNTDFVLDLADWGCSAAGTKVQLMRLKPNEPCQMWKYTRCEVLDDGWTVRDSRFTEKHARNTMPAITAETVIIADESDYRTVTRTTTTTTITTITTVTRTPRS